MKRWIYSAIQYQSNIQLLSSQITTNHTRDKAYNLFAETGHFLIKTRGVKDKGYFI